MNVKILAVPNDYQSGYYRIKQIVQHLPFEIRQNQALTEEDISWADVIWLQKIFRRPKIIAILHQRGKKVVLDVDDIMDDDNGTMTPLPEDIKERFYVCMSRMDAITTPSPFIAKVYGKYNSNFEILPNCIDPDVRRFKNRRCKDKKIRIGWVGGDSHFKDLEFITPILAEIHREYPQTEVIYFGFGEEYKCKWLKYYPWELDQAIYAKKFAELGFDIGIAPLTDLYLNHGKSELKWVEYSWYNIPSVVSNVCYEGKVRHALIAKDERDWFRHLSYLIENPQERKKMGRDAGRYVRKEYDLHKKIGLWTDFFNNLKVAN